MYCTLYCCFSLMQQTDVFEESVACWIQSSPSFFYVENWIDTTLSLYLLFIWRREQLLCFRAMCFPERLISLHLFQLAAPLFKLHFFILSMRIWRLLKYSARSRCIRYHSVSWYTRVSSVFLQIQEWVRLNFFSQTHAGTRDGYFFSKPQWSPLGSYQASMSSFQKLTFLPLENKMIFFYLLFPMSLFFL